MKPEIEMRPAPPVKWMDPRSSGPSRCSKRPLVPLQLTWTAAAAGVMTELVYGEEVVVSYLPLSHVAAQVNDLWISVKFAGTTYFASPDALKVLRRFNPQIWRTPGVS